MPGPRIENRRKREGATLVEFVLLGGMIGGVLVTLTMISLVIRALWSVG